MTMLRVKPETGGVQFPRFSNLFENFFESDFPQFLNNEWVNKVTPSVNIRETKEAYLIETSAPGFSKDSFKVKVEDGLLTISAEAKDEKLDEGEKFTRKEFSHSSFSRSFTLPKTVAADNISAGYENGILSVSLPKLEEAKSRGTIEVKIS